MGDLSGFEWQFVGFIVGFLEEPDKHLPSTINQVDPICRVCRVLLGGESPREFSVEKWLP
jgi:hypothetical protein